MNNLLTTLFVLNVPPTSDGTRRTAGSSCRSCRKSRKIATLSPTSATMSCSSAPSPRPTGGREMRNLAEILVVLFAVLALPLVIGVLAWTTVYLLLNWR